MGKPPMHIVLYTLEDASDFLPVAAFTLLQGFRFGSGSQFDGSRPKADPQNKRFIWQRLAAATPRNGKTRPSKLHACSICSLAWSFVRTLATRRDIYNLGSALGSKCNALVAWFGTRACWHLAHPKLRASRVEIFSSALKNLPTSREGERAGGVEGSGGVGRRGRSADEFCSRERRQLGRFHAHAMHVHARSGAICSA